MARTHLPPSIQRRMQAQQEVLERLASYEEPAGAAPAPFVTISRQYGCGAFAIAERLADRLNRDGPGWRFSVIDPKALEASETEIGERIIEGLSERTRSTIEDWIGQLVARRPPEVRVFSHLARSLCSIAARGETILIGRGGAAITRRLTNGVHIRLVAPLAWRISHLKQLPDRAHEAIPSFIRQADRERESFVRKYLGVDINDPDLYDLTLNARRVSEDEQVDLIVRLVLLRSPVAAGSWKDL